MRGTAQRKLDFCKIGVLRLWPITDASLDFAAGFEIQCCLAQSRLYWALGWPARALELLRSHAQCIKQTVVTGRVSILYAIGVCIKPVLRDIEQSWPTVPAMPAMLD
ncbi:hypothetical protein LPJ54_007323 [Coemansia sp. RSA 1824]|nr:hypothetical protein LPJ54_007323 [Coemansia sp. RSA 1824]